MAKPLAASKKLMQTYLSELLTEESEEISWEAVEQEELSYQQEQEKKHKLEKLLQQASAGKTVETDVNTVTTVKSESAKVQPKEVVVERTVVEDEVQIQTSKSRGELKVKVEKNYRKGSFQAMFFDVAGLTIAVPLIELGGIHNVDKTTSLVGKPDWFKGVMVHRDDKINVVDTALWVMPEKCDQALLDGLNYQYIIMLNESNWGLSAEHLVDTVTLEQEDVKWMDSSTKRPWLAGLVKDRMCALLDVESLISLLEDGANSRE
ncbi:chemotaxis protein CheW [Thalassotalea ganghwensis]